MVLELSLLSYPWRTNESFPRASRECQAARKTQRSKRSVWTQVNKCSKWEEFLWFNHMMYMYIKISCLRNMHHYMSIKIKNKIVINLNLSKLLSATMIYQLKESRRGCKKKTKNPGLLTQKVSLLGLVLTSANSEMVFLRLEFAAFYPRGSWEKPASWERVQTPQVSRTDKHTWANTESCTQPQTRQRREMVWEKGKAGCFLCWLVVCLFFLIWGLWSFLVFVTAGILMI